MEPLFVVAKMTGSPGKNDSLLFHSKLFRVWLWVMTITRGATSSSFRGRQFSWNFIWWRHRAYSTVDNFFADGHR